MLLAAFHIKEAFTTSCVVDADRIELCHIRGEESSTVECCIEPCRYTLGVITMKRTFQNRMAATATKALATQAWLDGSPSHHS